MFRTAAAKAFDDGIFLSSGPTQGGRWGCCGHGGLAGRGGDGHQGGAVAAHFIGQAFAAAGCRAAIDQLQGLAHGHGAAMATQHVQHQLLHCLPVVRMVPQTILEQQQVGQVHRGAPVGGGGYAQQVQAFHQAPVRQLLAPVFLEGVAVCVPDFLQGLCGLGRQGDSLGGGFQQRHVLGGDGVGQRRGAACGGCGQQVGQVVWADVIDKAAQQKAVVQGGEFFLAGGQLVGGGNQRPQRRLLWVCAIVKDALVHQREQGVEDGGAGLEHLVQKGQFHAGQVAVGVAVEAVVFQRGDGQGAEQFFRRTEFGEQVFKVAQTLVAAQALGNAPCQQAFAGAGRADEDDVLSRQHGQQGGFEGRFTIHQTVVEVVQQGLDFLAHGRGSK